MASWDARSPNTKPPAVEEHEQAPGLVVGPVEAGWQRQHRGHGQVLDQVHLGARLGVARPLARDVAQTLGAQLAGGGRGPFAQHREPGVQLVVRAPQVGDLGVLVGPHRGG